MAGCRLAYSAVPLLRLLRIRLLDHGTDQNMGVIIIQAAPPRKPLRVRIRIRTC